MKPDISIIVPIYNVEPYLATCLDSILAQTFKNFEIILIDDGSTDGSAQIAQKYAEENPEKILFFSQENSGPGPARNLGIEKSRGKYVLFVDSDDIVDPGMLEELYASASYLQTQVTICPYYRHGLYGELTMEGLFDFDAGKVYTGLDFLKNTDSKLTSCTKLYQIDFIKKYPFPSIWFEDIAWLPILMSYTETLSYVPHAFYHYLRHDTSIVSSVSDEQILGSVDAVRFLVGHANPEEKSAVATYVAKLLPYMCIRRPAFTDLYINLMLEYKDFISENCDFTEGLKNRYDHYYQDFVPIPKHIYYDHFGKEPLSPDEEENIRNWMGTLVEFDAKITCLNEDNCDITENPLIQAAYEKGNYDLVGFYFKCRKLVEKGGIALSLVVTGKKYITPLLSRTRSFFGFYNEEHINPHVFASAPGQPVMQEILVALEKELPDGSLSLFHPLDQILLEQDKAVYSISLETSFKNKYLSLREDTVRIYATSVFTNDYNVNAAYTVIPAIQEEQDEQHYRMIDDFYYQNLLLITKEYHIYQQNRNRTKQTEEATQLKTKICKLRGRIYILNNRAIGLQERLDARTERLEGKIAELREKSKMQKSEISYLRSELKQANEELDRIKRIKPLWFLYQLLKKIFSKKSADKTSS